MNSMVEDDVVRAVYERSYGDLVTYFVALSGSRTEAQELVQEVFLVADTHRADFAEAGDKDAWLRSLGTQLMDRRRRWARPVRTALPRSRREPSIDLGPEAGEDHVAVVDALSRLTLPVRSAAVLHHLVGLGVAEIARELRVPEGVAQGRLARARAELARLSAVTGMPPAPALSGFARDARRSLDQPPFHVMIARRRSRHRRRTATATVVALAAVLALVLVVAGLNRLQRAQASSAQAAPLLLPDWTAGQVVADPNAFVVRQMESRVNPSTGLTVRKRCATPRADHDCFGREAITVSDGAGHRLDTLGAVTGSSQQPSLGDGGLFREVGDGLWYWAHRSPGPYLVSAVQAEPVPLKFDERPVARSFGVPSIECPDRVGTCTLDLEGRAVERLARPDVPDARWAVPTAAGCGLWALAGLGGNLRLVIQQRDGTFATADIPDDGDPVAMAEDGTGCTIAYYQAVDLARYELFITLDQGRTWQVRQAPTPEPVGTLGSARPTVQLPSRWQDLPVRARHGALPGPLDPL